MNEVQYLDHVPGHAVHDQIFAMNTSTNAPMLVAFDDRVGERKFSDFVRPL